jgi:DNA repair protein RadA/Sms
MALKKSSTIYICSNCGKEHRTWVALCSQCGEVDTLKESAPKEQAAEVARAGLKSTGAITPQKRAATIQELTSKPIVRTPTGIGELDRVLGGGFVAAEVVLFAGAPGAGKSTLSLEIARRFADMQKPVLYSSGEESEQQIGLRAKRMGVSNPLIRIINETSLESLLGYIEQEKPAVLIVDSLQTLASSEIAGSVGSVSQSKEAAHALTRLAKQQGIIMVLVNQIVKSGEFAGSEAIQHIVDAGLVLESDGESPLKFLRATKNRFGETTEVGVFQHTEDGLEEVSDPSGIFLDNQSDEALAGAACSFISEGVRQIPVEVQALVTPSSLTNPRKQFAGVNFQRAQIVCAILDKFCNAHLYENDVFLNTVSGVRVQDPTADLAIAASVLSSLKEKPVDSRTTFIGELSLTGQVRGSFMLSHKIKEAERLGFTTVVVPQSALGKLHLPKGTAIAVKGISSVKELPRILGFQR